MALSLAFASFEALLPAGSHPGPRADDRARPHRVVPARWHANGRAGRDAVDPHRHRSAASSRCLARQRGFKNIAELALNVKGRIAALRSPPGPGPNTSVRLG